MNSDRQSSYSPQFSTNKSFQSHNLKNVGQKISNDHKYNFEIDFHSNFCTFFLMPFSTHLLTQVCMYSRGLNSRLPISLKHKISIFLLVIQIPDWNSDVLDSIVDIIQLMKYPYQNTGLVFISKRAFDLKTKRPPFCSVFKCSGIWIWNGGSQNGRPFKNRPPFKI